MNIDSNSLNSIDNFSYQVQHDQQTKSTYGMIIFDDHCLKVEILPLKQNQSFAFTESQIQEVAKKIALILYKKSLLNTSLSDQEFDINDKGILTFNSQIISHHDSTDTQSDTSEDYQAIKEILFKKGLEHQPQDGDDLHHSQSAEQPLLRRPSDAFRKIEKENEKIQGLQDQLAQLNQKLRLIQEQDKTKELTEELNTLKTELSQLTNSKAEIEKLRDQQAILISELTQKQSTLQAEIQTKTKALNESLQQSEAQKKDADKLEKENIEVIKRIQTQADEIEILKSRLKEIEESHNQLQNSKAKIEKLSDQQTNLVNQLMQKQSALQTEINTINKKLEAQEVELEVLRQQLEDVRQEGDKKLKREQQLSSQQLTQAQTNSEEVKKVLTQEIANLKDELVKMQAKLTSVQVEDKSQEWEKYKLETREKIKELTLKSKKTEESLESRIDELDQKEAINQQLMKEIERLRAEIDLNKQQKELDEALDNQDSVKITSPSKENIHAKNIHLNQQLEKSRLFIKALEKANVDLELRMEQLEKKLSPRSQRIVAQEDHSLDKQENESQKENLRRIQHQIKEIEKQAETIELLTKERDKAIRNVDKKTSDFLAEINEHDRQNQNLLAQNEQLKQVLIAFNQRLLNLMESFPTLQQPILQIIKEIKEDISS